MGIDTVIAALAAAIAAGALGYSARATRIAKAADRRAAALIRPVFEAEKFFSSDRFSWVEVRHIDGSIAEDVRVQSAPGEVDIPFKAPRAPGDPPRTVAPGESLTFGAPIGHDAWDTLDPPPASVVVRFRTKDGEDCSQALPLPWREYRGDLR